jgi:phenylpyruvate tautomerase PptA (4-oxalocrotonate tautomerase family)
MPMIDVYAPADLFGPDADSQLGDELTHAVLRAEGVASPGNLHLDNTAAFIHRLPAAAISTGSTGSARNVRIQILTPPGALNRDGQRQITKEANEIVARFACDPTQRTWVILTEAAEGGWGINGTALGVEEFGALAARARGW